ncbi:putative RNA-binding protein P16F5.06 [Hypsizygus marmoreus]|uniref:RNA-binding protein P16F5.06 n=1 Tax=Hypsizygus marmoreus TaxID=39966 RepID=A0A369K2D8_HYPMA|nr:putative RNA-binding protein P16F5.06 [Hypsizygus marmoreus]
MEDATITKKLHISGLTPALTPEDLSKRLSTFGTVKSLDGFGLQDGLGQPRKFGYVTLETTTGKLARCLNLLSGSTWKGAKLRIGEAKPDFAERLAAERQADEPPKKKRRRAAGVYAPDMSLVTPENVAERGGWKVTELGRVVRPVRMRPERPLPPPIEVKAKVKKDGKDGEKKKKKKRVKEPDVRARRRTIDVTRWGSVHLKGMFLEMEVVGTKRDGGEEGRMVDIDMESDASEEESQEDEEEDAEDEANVAALAKEASAPLPPAAASTSAPKPTPRNVVTESNTDVALEKGASLSLLATLFGDKDDSDWVGRESVGSDIDEDTLTKRPGMMLDGDDDDEGFEVVPRDDDEMGDSPNDEEEASPATEIVQKPSPPAQPTQKQQQATKLKDLFAPREEEAGFSLLGHLDLDLELDDEVPFLTMEPPVPQAPVQEPEPALSFLVSSHPHPQSHVPQLNTKQPLFFPHPPSSGTSTKARAKDLFDVARENRWSWRDPAVGFYRTGTEEEIRKKWEESKVELTREWKRRCREAGKVSRRRRGGEAGAGE